MVHDSKTAEIGVVRRFGLLLAPRRRARDQGRHAIRPAVGFGLPGRGRRAGASRSCRATAAATRSRRTGSTTGPMSGRCARSGSRRSSRRARPARSSWRSSRATSSSATSSSIARSGRADTFYDGPIVTHLSSAETYDPVLRELAIATIRDHGIEVHEQGTVVVIQRPALLDQVRVEVVQRRRLGGHQHDPVPRGVAVPRARDGGRQHQPDHRLRRGRPRGHRRRSTR